MDASVKIEGLEEAMKAMRAAFPKNPEQQRRLLNASMRNAAVQTILVEAKLRAFNGDSSGALAASLGVRAIPRRKLMHARKAGGVYIAPIRYDREAQARYIAYYYTSKGKRPGSKVLIDGIRHGHLVEFGHAKKGGGMVAARPFLWPAAQSKTSAYTRRFAVSLKKKTEAAVRRARKKAKVK